MLKVKEALASKSKTGHPVPYVFQHIGWLLSSFHLRTPIIIEEKNPEFTLASGWVESACR